MGPKGAASEQERWAWRAPGQGGGVGVVGCQRGGQLQEQLTQQLSQALSSAVAGRLERSVRDEIKKTVPPCEFQMETSGQAIFEGPSPCQASSHGSTPPSFPCPRCLPESGARGWPAQQLGGHQTHSRGE